MADILDKPALSPSLFARVRESLPTRVHRDLSARINSGEFGVGAQLPTEKDLAGTYGVSRPVIREAISILRADGLVQARQGAGVYSLGPRHVPYTDRQLDMNSVSDAIETLEVRLSIECEAAALAAARRTSLQLADCTAAVEGMRVAIESGETAINWDMRFHESIASMTHNAQFQMLFQIFGDKLIPRTRFAKADGDPSAMRTYLHRVNGEHKAILSAIECGDSDTARAAMRLHLANVKEGLKAVYSRQDTG